MAQVNFAQLLQEYGGGEPVPDGEYDVVVTSGKYRTSRTNPPKDMVEARCRILSGPYANKVLVNNFTLTPDNPNAMFHWFKNFAALGLGNEYWAALPPDTTQALTQVANDLVNRTAHVSVKTDRGRQNVEGWTPLAPGAAAGAVAAPPTPQAGYGMQVPGMATQPFQQPGVPQYAAPPTFNPQPQVQVAPPGQVPSYAQPAPAAAPQPAQPMMAPAPQVAPMPQQPQPVAAMPASAPIPQAMDPAQGGFPTPPGFPGAVDPDQAVAEAPQPQVPDPNGQAPQGQQAFPIPGNPPPQVPV